MLIDFARSYHNGNYRVIIFKDGTKIRYNNEDKLVPDFAECVDLKITDKCDLKCPMCHESSTCEGKHADLNDCISFIQTMRPYTEVALGGGNPMSFPKLKNLLIECSNSDVIANITVNVEHLKDPAVSFKIADYMINDLISSVGISIPFWYTRKKMGILTSTEFMTPGLKSKSVLHMIVGMNTLDQIKELYGKGFRLLLLGYKDKGRGHVLLEDSSESDKIKKNTQDLIDNLSDIIKGFKVVSFDNLAIKQLKVKEFCDNNGIDFTALYMGNDGDYTMYVDLVKKEYAISSTSEERHKIEVMDASDIFKSVQDLRRTTDKNIRIMEE